MISVAEDDERRLSIPVTDPPAPKTARYLYAFQYLPGKRTYRIVLTIRNVPGALSDVLTRLASNGVNLNSISGSNDPEMKAGVVSIFGEATKRQTAAKEIQKALGASSFVIDARVEATDDDILIEKDLFPLRLSTGRRGVLAPQESFSSMLKAVRDTFGSGGDAIVFEQGVAAGRTNAKALADIMGRDKALESSASLFQLYTAYGLAKAVSITREVSPLKAELRFENSFECADQKSPRPYSQFIRGVIVGATEELFGINVVCRETNCAASGSPFCEFLVTEGKP